MSATAGSRLASEIALRRIAADQRGLFTLAQARAEGWGRQRLYKWSRSGRVHRVRPEVYRFAGPRPDWESDLLAAVLTCGEGCVASHRSAMALHGIEPARRRAPTPLVVSVPAGRDARLPGVVVHRVRLPMGDVTTVDGIPCTTYERTLVDSAARLGLGQLARGLDQGLVTNRATLASVERTTARLRPAPGRRRASLRFLVAERGPETERADSAPEVRLLRAIAAAGLPAPIPQFAVTIDGESYFLDAAYPRLRLGIEYQGWDPHRTRSKFDADHRRDRLLTLAGWSVLYFTSATSTAETVEHIKRLRTQSPAG